VSLSQGDVCLSCPGAVELGILLPHLAGVIVEEVTVVAVWVPITLSWPLTLCLLLYSGTASLASGCAVAAR
jgi:hypothetical protein